MPHHRTAAGIIALCGCAAAQNCNVATIQELKAILNPADGFKDAAEPKLAGAEVTLSPNYPVTSISADSSAEVWFGCTKAGARCCQSVGCRCAYTFACKDGLLAPPTSMTQNFPDCKDACDMNSDASFKNHKPENYDDSMVYLPPAPDPLSGGNPLLIPDGEKFPDSAGATFTCADGSVCSKTGTPECNLEFRCEDGVVTWEGSYNYRCFKPCSVDFKSSTFSNMEAIEVGEYNIQSIPSLKEYTSDSEGYKITYVKCSPGFHCDKKCHKGSCDSFEEECRAAKVDILQCNDGVIENPYSPYCQRNAGSGALSLKVWFPVGLTAVTAFLVTAI